MEPVLPKSDPAESVAEDPRYHRLVKRRWRYSLLLTFVMLVAYFGYILLIAFDKEFLARRIAGSATTLGIPIGIGVILLGILLTGLYVRRANHEFDRLTAEILDEAGR